jgi:hypothetical protein
MGIVFALVLLGCADDGSACQRLDAEPKQYVSKTLCEAEGESALASDAALRADFPNVETRCVAAKRPMIAVAGLERPTQRLSNARKAARP